MSLELTTGEARMVQHADQKALALERVLINGLRDGLKLDDLHEAKRCLKEISGTVDFLLAAKTPKRGAPDA